MRVPSDVLLLCWRDTRHPQGGGSETYLERVGAELARRGARVTFLTSSYPGGQPVRSTATACGSCVPEGGSACTRACWRRSWPADSASGRSGPVTPKSSSTPRTGVPFFATLVASAPTVVLVHHCHREQWPVAGRLLGQVGWFIESRLSPRIHRRNRYVTVSTPSKTELVALGVDAERISVVRNGIDPVPADALLTGGAADGGSGPVRLCVLSRLVPHKQVEDALTVLAQLRRSGGRRVPRRHRRWLVVR